ncbi:Protein OSCP1 [Lamellibrachia satsuma]|nr:Protein OSCP1 [Lamellibrachia satsuma]
MMYILDQRLRAQNIPDEKAKKVMHDITSTMFNTRFMEELFKPQEIYSKKAMRTVFDRLAHASIMRLNAASMDKDKLPVKNRRIHVGNKLYDLMTMAFKHQVSLALRPRDILLITLNHMDAIKQFVVDSPGITTQVDNVYRLFIHHFASLTMGEFMLIRQTLLHFFQDMHIRVSIFLKDKVQSSNGHFVLPTDGPIPWGTELPGTIRIYTLTGEQKKTMQFNCGGKWKHIKSEGSFDIRGDRGTRLGTNMYNVSRPALEAKVSSTHVESSSTAEGDSAMAPNPLATAQLDLLSKLIGRCEMKGGTPEFRLNLFNTDEEEEEAALAQPVETDQTTVIKIDASKQGESTELSRIMGELDVGNTGGEEQDLLDLMDSAK